MTSNESLPANLVQLVNKTFILSLYKQERDKAFSMKDKIDRLVFSAMVGFYSYEPNIRSLKAEMDSDTFKGELEKKYKERLRDQTN